VKNEIPVAWVSLDKDDNDPAHPINFQRREHGFFLSEIEESSLKSSFWSITSPPEWSNFTANQKGGYRIMNGFHLECLIKEHQREMISEERRNQTVMEDKKMAQKKNNIMKLFALGGIVGMSLFLLVGCGSGDGTSVSQEGSGTIMLYNYDNHDYRVELRQTSDDHVLGVLTIRDFNVLEDNWIDSFEDVPQGIYYLIIFRNEGEVDRTNDFYIAEGHTVCYQIQENGSFAGC
jgi:hypothetical protein